MRGLLDSSAGRAGTVTTTAMAWRTTWPTATLPGPLTGLSFSDDQAGDVFAG